MALITRAADASMDITTALWAPQITGLILGEDVDVVAPCYIKNADGKVYMCDATAADEKAVLADFSPRAGKAGEAITLFAAGARFRYGSGLTKGAKLFLGTTKGRLDGAATTGDAVGVAPVINDTDIRVTRMI
jgi:hypothetical protein